MSVINSENALTELTENNLMAVWLELQEGILFFTM